MNPGSETFTVQLSRDASAQAWGFRLQGGADFATPLSVQSVIYDQCFMCQAFVLHACSSSMDSMQKSIKTVAYSIYHVVGASPSIEE